MRKTKLISAALAFVLLSGCSTAAQSPELQPENVMQKTACAAENTEIAEPEEEVTEIRSQAGKAVPFQPSIQTPKPTEKPQTGTQNRKEAEHHEVEKPESREAEKPQPTAVPTVNPTPTPTVIPTPLLSATPTTAPTPEPTTAPTEKPKEKVWVVDVPAQDEIGHWETVLVSNTPIYACKDCGAEFSSTEAVNAHIDDNAEFLGNGDHTICGYDFLGEVGEYEEVWVIDVPTQEEIGHWEYI